MTNIPTSHNNPGDLKVNGEIATNSSPQDGYAKLLNDLTAKMSGTSSTGIGPSSSLVDFSKVWAPESDNNNPAQYAANLANKLGVSPDTQIGTLKNRIGDFADAISGNEGYQSQNGYNPKPFSSGGEASPFSIDTSGNTQTQNDNTEPKENLWQKAGDVAKGVGNFLFPIVGDIKHDIEQGTFRGNGKSILQQTGDLALSALPFIPGLGEVGEAAKVGEAGIGGAEALNAGSKALEAAKGLNPIVKGAGVGYGAGIASNLSQGQDFGSALLPNANTISGAIFGGATPAVMKGLGSLATKISGISPQIENELSNLGSKGDPNDVKLFNQYISAAKDHSTNLRATSPLTMAADNLDTAAEKIQSQVDKAGKAVGTAKANAGTVPLKDLSNVGNSFWKDIQDKYGLNLQTKPNGTVVAKPIEGSMLQISGADKSRIVNIAQQLSDLHNLGAKATVKQATEVMDNLDKLVDFSRQDAYGHTNDPLESLIKHTGGNLNNVVRESSPELATANDKFSGLKDLQKEVSGMAGKTLNKGELLMRRIFSGDKSGDVQDLFGKIKDATGIDLVKHAVLAKNAIESVGSKADKTLLEQAVGGIDKGGFGTAMLNIAKGAARKFGANPETIGRNLVKGGGTGMGANLVTKGAIEASRGVKPLQSYLLPKQ